MTGYEHRSIRAAIIDDHHLFRDGLYKMLTAEVGIDVVAEGAGGSEAVRVAAETQPDVLLLGVELPGQPVTRIIEQLRWISPTPRVIVLTRQEDATLLHDLLDCGAAAYLTKNVARAILVAAVRSVANTTEETVTVVVSKGTARHLYGSSPSAAFDACMSKREKEILALVAEAKSNAQIAKLLFITEGTVKRHLTNVYAKLGAVSRVDALRKAARSDSTQVKSSKPYIAG